MQGLVREDHFLLSFSGSSAAHAQQEDGVVFEVAVAPTQISSLRSAAAHWLRRLSLAAVASASHASRSAHTSMQDDAEGGGSGQAADSEVEEGAGEGTSASARVASFTWVAHLAKLQIRLSSGHPLYFFLNDEHVSLISLI